MLNRPRAAAAIVVSTGFVLSAAVVLAGDMRVLESNVDKYPVGAVLPDTHPMNDLPQDGRVRVLLLSPMTTKLFEGPRGARAGPVGGTRAVRPTPPSTKRD